MQRSVQGLSLFELLIVLLLFSIIFAYSLPLTSHWYQNQFTFVMQKDIEQALDYGIQKSMILGVPLRLIPLHNQNWDTGLALVREDDVGDSATPLYIWSWGSAAHISWHGFLSDAYLRFVPDLAHSALNGYFLLEDTDHGAIKILVNRVGRVR